MARIQPEWAEALGAHLVKRSYSEPTWDTARGTVIAIERVTFYGVPIVAGRRVDYGPIDPAVAREMFIRHALVEGDWETHHAFLPRQPQAPGGGARPGRTEPGAATWSSTTTRSSDFYDRRVGPNVVSARHFDTWWKAASRAEPGLLDFTPEVLVPDGAPAIDPARFPDRWRHRDLELDVTYEFEPGSEEDGVTVYIPVSVLSQVTADGFDWQVPGLREELVTALIRTLPKQVRRNFVPAPDYARAFLADHGPDDGPLLDTLERALTMMTGDPIPPGSWRPAAVPDHLQVTFRVEDGQGRNLAASKDLDALKAVLRGPTGAALARVAKDIERTGLRTWSFGTLPRMVETVRAGQTVRGYPSLVDAGDSVDVRVLESEAEQHRAMKRGTRRLLLLNIAVPSKQLQRRLTNETRLALVRSPYRSVAELLADCTSCAVDHLVDAAGGAVFDEEEFAALAEEVRVGLPATAEEVVTRVASILTVLSTMEKRMSAAGGTPVLAPAVDDVRAQLDRLVHPGFVTETGFDRLADVARYVRAADRRLEKLPSAPGRDAALMHRIARLEAEYRRARRRAEAADLPGTDAEIDAIGWMIEDLRVSFFAQMLGTPRPVSEERIHRALERLARAQASDVGSSS